MSTELPQWIIYRLEMVYFDLATQRWQFFQNITKATPPVKPSEDTNNNDHTTGHNHRSYIEILLNSIEDTLKEVPIGTPFSVNFEHNTVTAKSKLFGKDEITSLKGDGSVSQDVWNNFVNDIFDKDSKDNILDDTLKRLREEIMRFFNDENSVEISPADANRLLSLIAIPAYWDLYGAMGYAWKKEEKGKEPKNTLWQIIGRLTKPFCCTHLIYQSPNDTPAQTPNDQSSNKTSDEILGYPMDVEAIFCDLTAYDSKPTKISCRDYYKYAFSPASDELTFYRIYAFFMDNLQKFLSQDKRDKHIYYLSYPIISSIGRKHFLNIYVKPEGITNSPIPIEDLYEAWQQLHSQISWDDLNAMLVNECEQIDITRFQKKIYEVIRDKSENTNYKSFEGSDKRNEWLSTVAENLYLLFPVEYSCFKKIDTSNYEKICEYEEVKESFKKKWTKISSKDCENCPDKNSGKCIKSELVKRFSWGNYQIETRSPLQSKIINDRLCRLLMQQTDYTRNVWNAFELTREETLTNNKNYWDDIKSVLASGNLQLLDEIIKIVKYDDDKIINTIFTSESCNDIKSKISEIFHLTDVNELTKKFNYLITYLSKNLLEEILNAFLYETISHYIETGPIKWLTHAPDHESGEVGYSQLKTKYKEYKNRVMLACNNYPLLSKYLKNLNDKCDNCLSDHSEINQITLSEKTEIAKIRKTLSIEFNVQEKERMKKFLSMNNYTDFVEMKDASVKSLINIIKLNLPEDFFNNDKDWEIAISRLRNPSLREDANLDICGGILQLCPSTKQDKSDKPFNKGIIKTINTSIFVGVHLNEEYIHNYVGIPEHLKPMRNFLQRIGKVFWWVKENENWKSKNAFYLDKENIIEMQELNFVNSLLKQRNHCELLQCKMSGFYIPR